MSNSLYGPSVQHSTWRRVAMSDSGQLTKRGTTCPASYEKLLREEAPLGQLARLEPLQPDASLCKLPILEANPSCAHWALAHSQWYTQPSPVWYNMVHSSALTKDLGFQNVFKAGF